MYDCSDIAHMVYGLFSEFEERFKQQTPGGFSPFSQNLWLCVQGIGLSGVFVASHGGGSPKSHVKRKFHECHQSGVSLACSST